MPVYRKGKKWRVVVWSRGMRFDFILEGSKKDAESFEARKRVQLDSQDPESLNRDVPRFCDFALGAYKEHAKNHLKAKTFQNREYTLDSLADHFTEKLNALSLSSVEKYKNMRIDDGMKPSTINDELKVFRTVLTYAKELGAPVVDLRIKDIPTRGIKRKTHFWTDAEVERLLAAIRAKSPEILGLVVFLLNTGCRKGEALALEWRCIDRERRLIIIEPNEEWQPKNGESREIPISDALLPYLVPRHTTDRFVFTSRRGDRYAYWPQRDFDRARLATANGEQPAIEGGPHSTRHTFATHFLAGCPDLYLLGKLLGHSTAYVTELYAHLLPDHLARARNVVNFAAGVAIVKDDPKEVL